MENEPRNPSYQRLVLFSQRERDRGGSSQDRKERTPGTLWFGTAGARRLVSRFSARTSQRVHNRSSRSFWNVYGSTRSDRTRIGLAAVFRTPIGARKRG